jgi:hypothetical protein
MTVIAYKTIDPPFTLKFWDMSKKELRDYYHWFQEVIPERIDQLTFAVTSSPGFEDWRPNFKPQSLNRLGTWFAGQVETRPRTQDEIDKLAERPPRITSDRELTNRTISLSIDIGMYLSETLLKNVPSLQWDQAFGSKKYIDYGQPVLVGFDDGIPMNPVRVITGLAYGLLDGSDRGNRLREFYDKVYRETRAEEK